MESTTTNQLEPIFLQIKQLTLEEKLQLLQWLAEDSRLSAASTGSAGLIYGKYRNTEGRISTEEDFKIAEWNPTEAQLNGA